MVNGLYTSSASMMHLQKKQDINSNNLANANSTGFKLSKLITKTEIDIGRNAEQLLHQDEDQNLDEVMVNFDQGPLVQTDNPMDIALSGDGFFAVQVGEDVRYTRNGSFKVNPEGELVTLSGNHVLLDNGDIIRIEGGKLTVASDGGVFVDGDKIGDISLVNFSAKEFLIPQGGALYENVNPAINRGAQSASTIVRQGYLEGSNVNSVSSMVDMISHFRNYEASQKALHAIDETLQKAVNEVGKVQ